MLMHILSGFFCATVIKSTYYSVKIIIMGVFEKTVIDHDLHEDEAGVYYILDDLLAREPERFGDDEQRKSLLEALALIPDDVLRPSSYIAELFKHYEINPLADIEIFSVAPYARENASGLFNMAKRYELTDQYTMFFATPSNRERSPDVAYASEILKNGKFDYVLTGNVVNDPKNTSPLDTVAASAMLLKKGGLALHMTSYSDVRPRWCYYPRFIEESESADPDQPIPEEYPISRNSWRRYLNDGLILEGLKQSFEGTGHIRGIDTNSPVKLRQQQEINQLPDFAKLKRVQTEADATSAVSHGRLNAATSRSRG